MTVEAWTRTTPYTISGIGPYAITHPYTLGAVRAFVVVAGVRVLLTGSDYTLTPTIAAVNGNLFLTPAAAATHAGRTLIIDRQTADEQGWVGTLGEREKGMEAALDRLTQSIQEIRAETTGAIRTRNPLDVLDWTEGTVPILQGGKPRSGPAATDIANAQQNAAAATAAAAAAQAAALTVPLHVQAFANLATITPAQLAIGADVIVRDTNTRFRRVSAAGYPDYTGTGGVMLSLTGAGAFITPAMLGNLTNLTNDAALLQQTLDTAAQLGCGVVIDQNATWDGPLYLRNGIRFLTANGGTLKRLSATARIVGAWVSGPITVTSSLTDCRITGLKVNSNGFGGQIIYVGNPLRCDISDNLLTNVDFSGGGERILVRSHAGAERATQDCTLSGNFVLGTGTGTGTDGNAIVVDAEVNIAPYADLIAYWKNLFTMPLATHPAVNVTVDRNTANGGLYGLGLNNAYGCKARWNKFSNNIRGISVQMNTRDCFIAFNEINECASSAIHLAYVALRNTVRGNKCTSARNNGGEAFFQAYVGSQDNVFEDNESLSTGGTGPQFHCYTGVHANGNKFRRNIMRGSCARAFMGLSSAWLNSISDPYSYSFGKDVSINGFTATPTERVIFKDNLIDSASTAAAIMLEQVTDGTAFALTDIAVEGTRAMQNGHARMLHMIEMTANSMFRLSVANNPFHPQADTSKFTLPRGRDTMIACINNGPLTEATINFPANGTTPNVGFGSRFDHVDTIATNVTEYQGGTDGQVIHIRLSINTTIVHNATKIKLRGAVNATGNSDNLISLVRRGGVWLETARNY